MSGIPGWLAGTGRSGTTWLGNMVHGIAPCKQIFEPLNPARVSLPPSLQPRPASGARPWLEPGQDNQGWVRFITDVLERRYDNGWTRYGHYAWKRRPRIWLEALRSRHVVVKEVRSNLLLGWLASQMKLRPVLLIRHPCPTVASQLQRNWRTDISPLLDDKGMIDTHFSAHADYLRNLRTDTQRLAARWAIENLIPLRHARSQPILVVTYEETVLDPIATVRKIATHWGWPIHSGGDRRFMRRVNAGVSGLGRVTSPEQLIGSWQETLDRSHIAAILEVTKRLGVDMYNRDPMPHRAANAAIGSA